MADGSNLAVTVADKRQIASGIHLFELRSRSGAPLPAFTPGSHIEMPVPAGGVRKYSLCNAPEDSERYVIAVKLEEAGRGGSLSLVAETGIGAELVIGAPRNDFVLREEAPEFLFIAGGIGITPIRSMIRHLLSQSRTAFRLYYFSRSPAHAAFRDEFAAPDMRGKAVLHHDGGDPAKSYDLWGVLEKPTRAHIYCCGPRPLMESVRDMTGHWPSSAVHFEDFGSAVALRADNRPFTVRLARSGRTLDVPAARSLLEVLRLAGCDVPSSCESGTCGTCRTRLLEGVPEHRDLVLSGAEQDNAIMVCVSRALSPELVLDL